MTALVLIGTSGFFEASSFTDSLTSVKTEEETSAEELDNRINIVLGRKANKPHLKK